MRALRIMTLGRWLVGVDWSSDGTWEWTDKGGRKHIDLVALVRLLTEDTTSYRLTLGPFVLLLARVPE
jgi:hypothetical protein